MNTSALRQEAAPKGEDISLLRRGDSRAFEQIIRTHNQRLYRIARAILRDGFEAEDVVQEVYIKAFTNLDTLIDAKFQGAWLAKITANFAISRLRQKNRNNLLVEELANSISTTSLTPLGIEGIGKLSPEHLTSLSEIRALVEREIDALPDGFREVFVLRLVEDMSVSETAELLELTPQTVKSRLSRGRAKIQHSIKAQITAASLQVFPFAGIHCDRITANTLASLEKLGVVSMG